MIPQVALVGDRGGLAAVPLEPPGPTRYVGVVTARRLHLCDVLDGRITAVTTYCNGGWNAELRTRHAAEAPMIRA